MYDKFFSYLGELEESYKKLSDLLKKKLVALETEDTAALDGIIKEEQVFVLLSKGFEGNLQGFRSELELSGERLSDIIEELPREEHSRFRDRFRTLQAALTEAKALEDKCRGLLDERLHALQKAMRELEKNTPARSYNSSGQKPDDHKLPLLRTSI